MRLRSASFLQKMYDLPRPGKVRGCSDDGSPPKCIRPLASGLRLQPGHDEIRALQRRPHSALGNLTPAAYAANLSATCGRLRTPDLLRPLHVAPPAPNGVKSAEALIAAG
jgi:hypothetical protein